MPGAGCEHEVVVVDRAVGKLDTLRTAVDACDLAEPDRGVTLARQDRANRPGDVGRCEPGRRDLIQQRLKQVIVLPVDEHDIGACPGERLRGEQAAETRADNDDAGGHSRGSVSSRPGGRCWSAAVSTKPTMM